MANNNARPNPVDRQTRMFTVYVLDEELRLVIIITISSITN